MKPPANGDSDITLESWEYYGFLWLKRRRVFTTYRGSGTVWRNLETGKRCPTWLEADLADIAWKRKQDEKDKHV